MAFTMARRSVFVGVLFQQAQASEAAAAPIPCLSCRLQSEGRRADIAGEWFQSKAWCSPSNLANPTESHPTEITHLFFGQALSFGIAFRHQYIERGELGQKMLEAIPNAFKRERRREVIEQGTHSKHFIIAVERMVLLLDEMEEALVEHQWLASDEYSLADVAFTPYLA